jgi:hypothetical protein
VQSTPAMRNAWTITTPMSFMNIPILSYIMEISPRPVRFTSLILSARRVPIQAQTRLQNVRWYGE